MKKNFALLIALAAAAHAEPRTSANYTILTDTIARGGGQSASASYSNTGSAGGTAGIATSANDTLKAGFTGQLNEIAGIAIVDQLGSEFIQVNETTQFQLGAIPVLDDGTRVLLLVLPVTWSVPGGPLTIDPSGLATAGAVFQNTAATARAVALGFTADNTVIVTDSLPDNFGSYAGDGIADSWQNQYFGLNNPLAAPLLDPDGDGQTNAFEFTAGLVPTDPASRFTLTIAPVPGQPGQKRVIFSPRLTDRTYTVKAKTSLLTGSYLPLTNPSAPTDNGQERTITDLSATGATKFYQVEITKP
jgi:hypothetical protein